MKKADTNSSIAHNLYAIYSEERLLSALGVLGLVLGIIALAIMKLSGEFIPPEGYIYKAASFDIALGIYTLTLILFIPLAGFSTAGRRRWRWWSVALVLYAYASENTQIYRGIDPRFTRMGTAVDQVIGALLGLTALGLIVTFMIFAWRFFGERNAVKNKLLLLGIRYGIAAVVLAFIAGFWMGALQASTVGPKGNLLPLHAAGFHGLQAIPFVALLLSWSELRVATARRWVHVSGIAWLAACAAIAWQTAQGRTVLEASPAMILALLLTSVWLICAVAATITWRRTTTVRYSD
jgi:hypothetical protein